MIDLVKLCCLSVCLLLSPCVKAETPNWNLFATADQKAQRLFNASAFAQAAVLFTDPQRQGDAWYRAGEFGKAASAYGRSATVEGLFNRGNSFMLLGHYQNAIEAYQQVLNERDDWTAAQENLNLARLKLQRMESHEPPQGPHQSGTEIQSDEIVFDLARNEGGDVEVEELEEKELDEAALRKMWLRRVETRTADFLKRKFAYQHAKARNEKANEKAGKSK